MEKLHEKIRRIRTEKSISQVAAAKAIGISRGAYVLIENGTTTSISIEVGKGISQVLGVSFSGLFEIGNSDTEKNSYKIQLEKCGKRISELEKQISDKELIIELLSKEKENYKRVTHNFLEEMVDTQEWLLSKNKGALGLSSFQTKQIEKTIFNPLNINGINILATIGLIDKEKWEIVINKYERLVKPGNQEEND